MAYVILKTAVILFSFANGQKMLKKEDINIPKLWMFLNLVRRRDGLRQSRYVAI